MCVIIILRHKNAVIEEGLSRSKIMKCFLCGSGGADKLPQADNQKIIPTAI